MHASGRGASAQHARKFATDLSTLPGGWAQSIIAETCEAVLAAPTEAAEVAAWFDYERAIGKIVRSTARLDADEENIRIRAQRAARHCLDMAARDAPTVQAGAYPIALCRWILSQGVPIPPGKRVAHVVARAVCPSWWRRQCRRQVARAVESNAIALGFVSKRRDPYVSAVSLSRRRMQLANSAAMMDATTATNEWAQQYTLAELAGVSPAAKDIRRHELIIRLKGFEEYAQRHWHDAQFVTLTCPSRFHARIRTGEINPKWDGRLTPLDAQEYLRKVWARIRAKLARMGVNYYGFRIAEPHGDGTPHWHFVLFAEGARHELKAPNARALAFVGPPLSGPAAIRSAFLHYGLADEPEEPGAREHRVTAIPIEAEKGSATGYAIKYISKNIDGFRIGEWRIDGDLVGDETLNLAPRVEAWAATWGIRQFQQIGGPAVGLWREFRRVGVLPPEKAAHLSDEFASCFFAANRYVNTRSHDDFGELQDKRQADWCAFMLALKPYRWRRQDIQLQRDVAVVCNRYGEVQRPKVLGLRDRNRFWRDYGGIVGRIVERSITALVPSVRHEWTIHLNPKGNKPCTTPDFCPSSLSPSLSLRS